MSLALIAALPFLGALLPAVTMRFGRNVCAIITGSVTLMAIIGLLAHAPAVLRGQVVQTRTDWLPLLGLNANFMLDGLGLLFAGLILGIGLLIVLYARFYLLHTDSMGRFFTFLLLFQGAMLGIVLSDNILLLLVFWELTSLASFLLIGYWSHSAAARQGARMALAVTGMGGLALMGGMLLLGHIAGSFDLSVILTRRDAVQASPLYLPALILILLGCFTKSAQVPFHFWLPHAMAAPTPVSAYLHSATMVKAGLFLMARLWPVLAGTEAWFYIVATTGLVTMVTGAAIALFRDDMKALLAYSTVSHLGLITMLLGFGTGQAAVAAVFHILNHAVFKAALFMVTGIVDHAAHTRDIARLGGLRRVMPVTAAIGGVGALAMAGIPPLNGFLSKEMMLEAAAHTGWMGNAMLVPLLATLGAMLSVAYSLRFVGHVFLGPVRQDYPAMPRDPGLGLWAAPALLAGLAVLAGLIPAAVAGGLVAAAAAAVTGGELPYYTLALWHGVTPALFMGGAAVAGGGVLLWRHTALTGLWEALPLPAAKPLFDAGMAALVGAAGAVGRMLEGGRLSNALAVLTLTVLAGAGAAFLTGAHLPGLRIATPVAGVPTLGFAVLLAAVLATVALHRQRLLALLLMGGVGLVLSLGFAYFSAPDLALTQITVEVVTVVLLLLALNLLPPETPSRRGGASALRDGVVAGAAGLGAAALTYAMLMRNGAFPSIAGYHIDNAYSGAGGTNVVNVIIVDFRAYDTWGEIIVLGIAALLIHALTEALLAGRAVPRPAGPPAAGDPYPVMMRVVSRVMLPLALTVGVYLLLRGHYEPGGGFVAGLVVAIAALMQLMASGSGASPARLRPGWHGLIGAGVLIAGLTGAGAWLAGRPFLTSAFGYLDLPPLQPVSLATAMAFDLGVFVTVLGAVMLMLSSLVRLGARGGAA